MNTQFETNQTPDQPIAPTTDVPVTNQEVVAPTAAAAPEGLFFSNDVEMREIPRDKEGHIDIPELAKTGYVLFDASEAYSFQSYITDLRSNPVLSSKISTYFQTDDEENITLPEGFCMFVHYVRRRADTKAGETGLQLDRIVVGAIPTVEFLTSSVAGKDFSLAVICEALLAKIMSAIDSEKSYPKTVPDFIVSGRKSDPGLAAFRKIAPAMCEGLKALTRGKLTLTPNQLQTLLSSSRMSESLYPKLDKEFWEKIIDRAIQLCEKQGLSSSWFTNAKTNRDIEEDVDFSMDEIDDGLAGFLAT